MKRYTKEFITEQIKKYPEAGEIKMALQKLLSCVDEGIITDLDAIRATVRAVDEYECRKATEQAEKDFNEYEAEYGADGAEWRRRGGSAW